MKYRSLVRRAVHDALAVEATYSPLAEDEDDVTLNVRWHAAGERLQGDLQGQGYAEVIADKDRIIFDAAQLETLEVVPQRGDRIIFTDPEIGELVLEARLPTDGPVTVTWEVTRA